VTPGRYFVQAKIVRQDGRNPGLINASLGSIYQEIVVPEIPGNQGYTREPFDVGSLAMKPERRLGAGQLAPDFQATTLDGRPVQLSDFRGKYLLIVFWSQSFQSDVSLAESRNLRALQKTFGKLGRFVMLGINYDDVDRTRNLVTQRGWDWLNASVSSDVWDKLVDEYSLPRHGSVWLIGPDGKVLARDLRGDGIRQAGTMVLRAR
jgi:peroxiredoxin